MKVFRAITGGLVGGVLAIAIIRAAAWLSGADADICTVLGAVVTGRAGSLAWIAGCVVQLVEAAAVAIVFAAIFEWVTRRSGGMIGLLLAFPLVAVAGLTVGVLPRDRLVDAGVLAPGAFMEYRGLEVVVGFIMAHLIFGIVVGAWYGQTRHGAWARPRAWQDVTAVERGQRAKE